MRAAARIEIVSENPVLAPQLTVARPSSLRADLDVSSRGRPGLARLTRWASPSMSIFNFVILALQSSQ